MPARPHVILLTCHDLGRHLGCYGVDSVVSPHLDALAAKGVRCDAAFCTSPGCSPARSSIATGRYPHSNGVIGLTHPPFDFDLHAAERPIAMLFGQAGYRTHLFGFQHVSPTAQRLGFHELHGFDGAGHCSQKALGAGVADRVVAFLAEPPQGPLYLEINLEEPHRPFEQGGAAPDTSRGVTVPGFLPDDTVSRQEFAAFQGAIRQGDAAIGRILHALDAAGMAEDTLVVFVSDHGMAMPRAKCTLYDPGLEVALLWCWPAGGLTGGRAIAAMTSQVDVLPTILEAAGVPLPAHIQGRSMLPLLRGEPAPRREEIFAEKTYHSYYDPMRAIRTERHKLILNFEPTFMVEVPADIQQGAIFKAHVELYHHKEKPCRELYDLVVDPLEQRNCAGEPAHAGVERELEARLCIWMEQTGDPLLASPIPSPRYKKAVATLSSPTSRSPR